jgi:hypothetical protein
MRIRETMAAIITAEMLEGDRTTDDLHILYANERVYIRKKYEISRDKNRDFSIQLAYNDFIKIILEGELDKKYGDPKTI